MTPDLTLRLSADEPDDWIRYFERRVDAGADLPWPLMVRLTADERQRVLPSIAIFQLGESGEGRHLFRAARRWADATGEAGYVAALQLFIEEEHRHAAMLGRYLDLAGHSRLERNWTDSVFRRIRKFAGLETAISVLLCAELIAMVYYAALRRSSGCPLLQAICRQILDDECGHIRFQSQQIGRLRGERPEWQANVSEALHAGLLAATSVVVWWTHRPVFRAAGWTPAKFASKLWGQYRAARSIMRSMRRTAQSAAETQIRRPDAIPQPRPCPA